MKQLGFAVFLSGLTVAAWFASKIVPLEEGASGALAKVAAWGSDAGLAFFGGIALMIVGGIIARRADRPAGGKSDEEGSTAGGDVAAALAMLETMAAKLEKLDASALPEGATELADELDALLNDQVPDFLEHRRLLIDRLGLGTFAEMIGSFAQMERAAARAWSAITDEVWSEVPPCLVRAREGLARAREVAVQPE